MVFIKGPAKQTKTKQTITLDSFLKNLRLWSRKIMFQAWNYNKCDFEWSLTSCGTKPRGFHFGFIGTYPLKRTHWQGWGVEVVINTIKVEVFRVVSKLCFPVMLVLHILFLRRHRTVSLPWLPATLVQKSSLACTRAYCSTFLHLP